MFQNLSLCRQISQRFEKLSLLLHLVNLFTRDIHGNKEVKVRLEVSREFRRDGDDFVLPRKYLFHQLKWLKGYPIYWGLEAIKIGLLSSKILENIIFYDLPELNLTRKHLSDFFEIWQKYLLLLTLSRNISILTCRKMATKLKHLAFSNCFTLTYSRKNLKIHLNIN